MRRRTDKSLVLKTRASFHETASMNRTNRQQVKIQTDPAGESCCMILMQISSSMSSIFDSSSVIFPFCSTLVVSTNTYDPASACMYHAIGKRKARSNGSIYITETNQNDFQRDVPYVRIYI